MPALVSICFLSFNHERYIAQALESVLRQESIFPFQVVIGEDCSADNTRLICERYAARYSDKIKLLPSVKNLGMNANFARTLKKCDGQYIAFLEGDDYWIDHKKIEKQVTYLNEHPECGLVFTNYQIVDETGSVIKEVEYTGVPPSGAILGELIKGGFPYPLTACFRREIVGDHPELFLKEHYKMGDFPLWLELGRKSQFHYLDTISSAYRRHGSSVTSNKNSLETKIAFRESWLEIQKSFLEKYKIREPEILRNASLAAFSQNLECLGMAIQLENDNLIAHYWNALKITSMRIPIKMRIQHELATKGWIGFAVLKIIRALRHQI